jgi:hypothetical protein
VSRLVEAELCSEHKISPQEMKHVHGGFFLDFLIFIKRLPYEDEMGEECNNGICVPYQEEGDY